MPTILRVTTVFTGAPVQGGGVNQLYFLPVGVDVFETAQTAAVDFWEDLKADIDSDIGLTVKGEVESIDEATGSITDVTDVGDYVTAGTSSGEMLPPVIQGLLRFRTPEFISGRRLRGRVFIPGMAEGNSDGGVPGSGFLGRLQGAGDTLVANGDAGFGIYSRTHHTFRAADSASAWSKWAELRSRRD